MYESVAKLPCGEVTGNRFAYVPMLKCYQYGKQTFGSVFILSWANVFSKEEHFTINPLIYFQNKFWAHYTGQITNASVDNPVGVIVGVVLGIAAFIIICILLFVVWKRRKDSKKQEDPSPYNRYPVLHYYSKKQSML